MSEYTDRTPTIVTDSEDRIAQPEREVAAHLDAVDEELPRFTYVFTHENRAEELRSFTQNQREQYQFTQGIVFPDVVEEYIVDLSDDEIESLVWAGRMTGEITEDMIMDVIAFHRDTS